jgi:hypothetical protein
MEHYESSVWFMPLYDPLCTPEEVSEFLQGKRIAGILPDRSSGLDGGTEFHRRNGYFHWLCQQNELAILGNRLLKGRSWTALELVSARKAIVSGFLHEYSSCELHR